MASEIKQPSIIDLDSDLLTKLGETISTETDLMLVGAVVLVLWDV